MEDAKIKLQLNASEEKVCRFIVISNTNIKCLHMPIDEIVTRKFWKQ